MPPNAQIAKSRGSRPRYVVTAFTARIIVATAIVRTPWAASTGDVPSGIATCSVIAFRAACGVEKDVAADELPGVQVAEHDERVGERRARPASPVAGGAGIGACALRADADDALRVDLDDAAAARSDLRHVDERELDGVAAALDQPAAEVDPAPTSYSLVRAGRPSSTSAALAVVPPMSSEIRFGRPVSRPSWPHAMTPAAGPDSTRCAGFRAAIAGGSVPPLDCMISSGASIPASRSLLRERVDVPADGGPEVRVDDGGARALVLADLGEDVGRPRDEDVVGDVLAQDLLDPALVGVVGVRVEQRDRHRLDSLLREPRRDVPNGALVERSPDLASRAEALAHLEAERPGHERLRLLVLQVVEHRDPQPAHLEDVAKALGRHERHGRAAMLEDGVRRDGGRMHHAADVRGGDLRVALETANAGDDALGVVGGRGEDLRRPDGAVGAEQHDVRERPADVDADAERPH